MKAMLFANSDLFKSKSVQEKWANAKKVALCYRCLHGDHPDGECPRSRVCNIDGCRDRYKLLLHGNRNGTKSVFRSLGSQPQGTQRQGASVTKNPASGHQVTKKPKQHNLS